MPTIFRAHGIRFVIYTNDHRPVHVHAVLAGAVAVIEVDDTGVTLRAVHGMSLARVRQAMELAYENRSLIRQRWEEIHGDE
jgi:hypothetical protein